MKLLIGLLAVASLSGCVAYGGGASYGTGIYYDNSPYYSGGYYRGQPYNHGGAYRGDTDRDVHRRDQHDRDGDGVRDRRDAYPTTRIAANLSIQDQSIFHPERPKK